MGLFAVGGVDGADYVKIGLNLKGIINDQRRIV